MIVPVLALALASPPAAVPVGDGFIQTTQYRTLARYQLAFSDREEYRKLYDVALQNSRRRPPRTLRILHVIVPTIDAQIEDKDGNRVRAQSQMTSAEINRCREWIDNYSNLVFAYTAGALKPEITELLLDHVVTQLDAMGEKRYWLSGHTALRGIEHTIGENYYDSISVYYKKPEEMQPGLLGGALGRDHGIRGSAFWTQWITDWNEPPSPFGAPAVVSLHEWLHNISYYAHRVMRYKAVPDCHAAEEYGYWDSDGGYRQWQAWNRDLMLRLIPREFWYRLDTRSAEVAPDAKPVNDGLQPGAFYNWRDVGADWHARLPALDDAGLQKLTGLSDLRIVIEQERANAHTSLKLVTEAKLESPYAANGEQAEPRLDNVLCMARRTRPSRKDDPVGSYGDAPIEGMAILRIPGAPHDRRDLVLVRTDLAPYAVPLLRVYDRRASESIVGFVHVQDPAEKQQVTAIALLVNFGSKLPADEMAAIGR